MVCLQESFSFQLRFQKLWRYSTKSSSVDKFKDLRNRYRFILIVLGIVPVIMEILWLID